MKKQITSLFLLFILIVPAVATYTWLQLHKCAVKREVKCKMIAGIDKKELVFFKFSKKEINAKLHWEHSKEFEFNDQMYDVVDKKVVNDSIALWCWSDDEETNLNKQLNTVLTSVFQKDSKSKDKQNQVFKFYKLLYFQDVFSWKPLEVSCFCKIILFKKIDYQSVCKFISLPPPKI